MADEFIPTGDSPREADDSTSIKSAIAAAIVEHDENAIEDHDAAVAAEAAKVVETKTDGERNTDGTFKKADEVKVVDKKDDKTGVASKAAEKTPDEIKVDEVKALEAPDNWDAKAKETFKKLPKDGQEFLLDRHRAMEKDYTEKTMKIADFQKEYAPVDAIFAPQRAQMKAANLTPAQLVQGWANAEMALMGGKGLELLPNIAKAYKVDPIQLATRILEVGGITDPEAAMKNIADTLKNRPAPMELPADVRARLEKVDKLEGIVTANEQQRADAEVARINGELDTFKSATDDKGVLLHPFYDEVLETMGQLVDQDVAAKRPARSIEQLYNDAIFVHPTVRQKWLDGRDAAARSSAEAAQRTAAEKAAEAARAKSEKAARAGSSVTGSAGTGQPLTGKTTSDNLRDTIAAAADDHTSDTRIH